MFLKFGFKKKNSNLYLLWPVDSLTSGCCQVCFPQLLTVLLVSLDNMYLLVQQYQDFQKHDLNYYEISGMPLNNPASLFCAVQEAAKTEKKTSVTSEEPFFKTLINKRTSTGTFLGPKNSWNRTNEAVSVGKTADASLRQKRSFPMRRWPRESNVGRWASCRNQLLSSYISVWDFSSVQLHLGAEKKTFFFFLFFKCLL